MPVTDQPIVGLTSDAAEQSRRQYGVNRFTTGTSSGLLSVLREVVSEPMFGLLLAACVLYFALGETAEGITLIVALLLVAGISVYQDVKSERVLSELRQLTQPTAEVLRDGKPVSLTVEEIVVGDWVRIEEGQRIPADGRLHDVADLAVDESVLTGEAVPVPKTTVAPDNQVFAGTSSTSGSGWFVVEAVGAQTELGRIGQSLESITPEKSPLQRQISRFVVRMAWIGAVAFVLVWGINYARSGDVVTSLLFGLTLAMSILPEEIPVAFSSFMALGAARLSRMGVLTKQPQTVESLGSATVICADKTGTLTTTGMAVRQLYDAATDALIDVPTEASGDLPPTAKEVLAYARWASETAPFDPMEKAIIAAFSAHHPTLNPDDFPLIHEYPLDGTPPMMTHVRRDPSGQNVVAAKGAVEHVLAVCKSTQVEPIRAITAQLSAVGYRVLGVAYAAHEGAAFPASQDDFNWQFLGLVALENPPKESAKGAVRAFGEAGIQVKMITGDHPVTAQAIARQVGLPNADRALTGQEVMALDEAALQRVVGPTVVFARMFPDAKLRVVEALKRNGDIVAMTGDGVNDGPALKAAHIGVAMGQRGTEVAKAAASLVLVNDDLSNMVDAVAQGRKIYQNLLKAISYIVSIHIPIILTVAVPLLANWSYINLFSPIHVIFLELVMGPTCSIAFENEPAEAGQMRQPPRPLTQTFLAGAALGRSIVQGLLIAVAVLTVYYVAMQAGRPVAEVRTLAFATLVLSNIFLTLIDRSFTQSVFRTLRVPNPTLWLMLGLTFGLLLAALFLPPVQRLFAFGSVAASDLGWCVLAALLGTCWIEGVKAMRH